MNREILKKLIVNLTISSFYLSLILPANLNAAPSNSNVVQGNANITQNGNLTNIDQLTDKAIINWDSFNINTDERVHFSQNINAAVLNRIFDQNASEIFGSLTADANVFLINPNGILFGAGSSIDVGSLIASTADISNENFMNGNYEFDIKGNPNAKIINYGDINIKDDGNLAFMAPTVENYGTINAKLGKVELAAGETFTLDFTGDGLIQVAVSDEFAEELKVNNSGLIKNDGGIVSLKTAAAQNALDNVINMEGIIEANTISEKEGKIYLTSGGDINLKGKINANGIDEGNGGEIIALAENLMNFEGIINAKGGDISGNGGFIETSGLHFRISETASVNTTAQNGETGTYLIDPINVTIVSGFDDIEEGELFDDVGVSTLTMDLLLSTTDLMLWAVEDIDVQANVDILNTSGNNLILDAGGDIFSNNGSTIKLVGGELILNVNQTDMTGHALPQLGTANRPNTIQDAIDVIHQDTTSATINLGAGTYSAENIIIDKSLTLNGNTGGTSGLSDAGSDGSVILDGGGALQNLPVGDAMIKIEADDVTISGLTFQNAGDAQAAIMAATVYDIDNVNITDNTFLSDAGNAAVLTWSGDATTFDNWTVERNFIDHMSGWPGAIELTNATNSMVKDNKIITDNIGVLMTSQYGADLMDNTITGNEITVLDPAPDVWDNGILIYSGVATPTPGNRAENILIENNTIYSEGNGIATWDGTGDGLFGIEVTNNTFGAIESNDIGTDVNYYSNHFKIGGANGITTIQEAVDLALEGDVLEIPDGIYNENLVIDKALFLEGSETADTIIAGTGSGTGLKIEADNIFINNLIVDNFHYGIHIDTDVSNLALDSVIVKNNTHGLMVSNTASLNFATIANSEFRGNNIGIYFAKEFSSPDDSTVSWLFMSGVTLENNVVKGMYAEKLENTWMEDLTVFNNGTSAAAWPPNNGIDINLKNGDYENIVITDSYFEQNGFYNGGDDLSGQLAIKARGTGLDSSYAAYPATLKNVAVFNNTFVRDPANAAQETHAIRLGEPGKLNTEPTEVYIYDNTFIGYDEDDKIVDVRDISVIDDSYLPPWLKSKNDSKKEVAGTYYGDYLTYLEKEEEKNNEYYKKIMNLAGKYNASDFTETASDRKVFHNKKLTMADLSVLQAYLLNGKISNNVEAIQALLEN